MAAIGDKLHPKHRYRVLARALSLHESLFEACCVPSLRTMADTLAPELTQERFHRMGFFGGR